MRLVRIPGVHRPRSDTWLLRDALLEEQLQGRTLADLCTGTGVLALAGARAGAAPVLAVDVSLRATLCAAINARLHGCSVGVRRGDFIGALGDCRFDVLVCNPPYVPARGDRLPRHRRATALDAGRDGRALLDRLCRQAPGHLRDGGTLLVVQSSVCGVDQTRELLEQSGLAPEVIARRRGPLGPVLRARSELLRARGLLGESDEEEIVVIRATKARVAERAMAGSRQ